MNKYRLTDEKMSTDLDLAAYRIVALRDFGSVKAGDLGGFIQKESNLSHDGDCWIDEHTMVVSNSIVRGDAQISYSDIWDGCVIEGSAIISGCNMGGQIKISGGNISDSRIEGRNITIKGGIITDSVLHSNVCVEGGVIKGSTMYNCSICEGDSINFDVDYNNFHTVNISYDEDTRLLFTIDCNTGLIHGSWKPMTIGKYIKVLRDGGFDKKYLSSLSLIIRGLRKLKTIKPTLQFNFVN